MTTRHSESWFVFRAPLHRLRISASPLAPSSRPLCLWSPLAITLDLSVALARPQTRQRKLSWLTQPRIASLRPATSSVMTVRRLLLCPINHHLVDWRDFPQYLRHHCRRFGLSTGNNTLSFFLSLFGYRVGSALASSQASQPLYGLLLTLRGLTRPPQSV